MNTAQSSTIQVLHERLALPKPTLYRILQTLQDEGYVLVDPNGGRYRLTAKVNELSAGYTQQTAIVDVGARIVLNVTKKIKWPLAIGMLDGDAISVRYSTMPYSPFAVHATTVGKRLGLIESAMGYTYLAFCTDDEREILLELLRSANPHHRLEHEADVLSTIARTRAAGYGLRLKNVIRESATIAVPIMRQTDVIAILSMTTFGNSMNTGIIEKFKPVLDETAVSISTAIGATQFR